MTSRSLKLGLLVPPLLAVAVLSACRSSNDRASPFLPVTPTPSVTPTPTPEPTPVTFNGDTAAFLSFVEGLDRNGEPIPVNDGQVQFTDTAEVTEPVPLP